MIRGTVAHMNEFGMQRFILSASPPYRGPTESPHVRRRTAVRTRQVSGMEDKVMVGTNSANFEEHVESGLQLGWRPSHPRYLIAFET